MTIDEAIKILEHHDDDFQVYTVTIFRYQAVKLGIEALKDILKSRKGTFSILLPGETEVKE